MISAFLIGLFGSMHCVGMCGPLMITFTRTNPNKQIQSFLLYHASRIMVYAVIGLLIGLMSYTFQWFQFQKYAMIVTGLLIIVVYGFPKLRNKVEGFYYHSHFFRSIKQNLSTYYSGRFKWIAAGVLNGLLPCGMIYLAAAGAILAGGFIQSIGFMILFGLGTLPALLTLALINTRFNSSRLISNLTTPIALLSGVILIARSVLADYPDVSQLLQLQVAEFLSLCGI